MDDKLKIAAVLLTGYLLGRTKRMKLALAAAGALAVRELRANPDLLKTGSSVLASPAVKKLTDELSGRLVDAGKTAVVAAAAKRVDGLVSNLEKRTGAPPSARGPEEDEPTDQPDESPEPADEAGDEVPPEETEEEEPSDEPDEPNEPDDEPAAARSAPRQRRSEPKETSRSSRTSGEGGSRKATSGGRGKKSSGTASTRKSTSGTSTRKPSSR
ncbi:hypothetical protein [Promicromonospora sp. NPDC050262]|uniref:hypothetical protein n=1 Tax=Promicromonospora sp. NPDC050262 TaxID=3155036 RepID=UPI0033DBE004